MVNFMRAAINAKRKYFGEPALSAADFLKLMRRKLGTHYGVNLARTNLQVYAFQYFFSLDGCAKATHIEQYSVISVHR